MASLSPAPNPSDKHRHPESGINTNTVNVVLNVALVSENSQPKESGELTRRGG